MIIFSLQPHQTLKLKKKYKQLFDKSQEQSVEGEFFGTYLFQEFFFTGDVFKAENFPKGGIISDN